MGERMRAPPSSAAVMATTSRSMRRTDGKTDVCIGLVCANAAYASLSKPQWSAPARYSAPDSRLSPSAMRTSQRSCARSAGGLARVPRRSERTRCSPARRPRQSMHASCLQDRACQPWCLPGALSDLRAAAPRHALHSLAGKASSSTQAGFATPRAALAHGLRAGGRRRRTRPRMRSMTWAAGVPVAGMAASTGSSPSPALPSMDARIFTWRRPPKGSGCAGGCAPTQHCTAAGPSQRPRWPLTAGSPAQLAPATGSAHSPRLIWKPRGCSRLCACCTWAAVHKHPSGGSGARRHRHLGVLARDDAPDTRERLEGVNDALEQPCASVKPPRRPRLLQGRHRLAAPCNTDGGAERKRTQEPPARSRLTQKAASATEPRATLRTCGLDVLHGGRQRRPHARGNQREQERRQCHLRSARAQRGSDVGYGHQGTRVQTGREQEPRQHTTCAARAGAAED